MEYHDLNLMEAAGKGYVPPDKPLLWALEYRAYPVVTFELPKLSRWYPICFEQQPDGIRMVLPASSEPGNSVLINPQTGKWVARAIPFFLRKFPFSLRYDPQPDGKVNKSLKILDDPEIQLSADAQQPVVDNNGRLTSAAQNMLMGMIKYDACLTADLKRIELFQRLDLFVPWTPDFGLETGKDAAPFLKIDETRLHTLSDDDILELHKAKAWRMLYGHIYSMSQSGMLKGFQKRLENRNAERSEQVFPDAFEDDGGLIEF